MTRPSQTVRTPPGLPSTGSPGAGTTTIGVAIAVPDPWGAQLQDYRVSLGDNSAAGVPTHVTLLPPFSVARSAVPAIEQHLLQASATHPGFRMHLRGTGTFRPVSPVVFVTVAEGISACEQLASLVRRAPLPSAYPFPYHPHVTVAHHLADEVLDRAFEELSDFECSFRVDRFALYVHESGTGWVPTRHFFLAGDSDRSTERRLG
ncbi:MAG TPA: 2'-5' RNA ligase family protein [Nocardioidaceae bacterium]|nr:2'-5' RNA ligase family protein [Nocardioidaceae bacterium]